MFQNIYLWTSWYGKSRHYIIPNKQSKCGFFRASDHHFRELRQSLGRATQLHGTFRCWRVRPPRYAQTHHFENYSANLPGRVVFYMYFCFLFMSAFSSPGQERNEWPTNGGLLSFFCLRNIQSRSASLKWPGWPRHVSEPSEHESLVGALSEASRLTAVLSRPRKTSFWLIGCLRPSSFGHRQRIMVIDAEHHLQTQSSQKQASLKCIKTVNHTYNIYI